MTSIDAAMIRARIRNMINDECIARVPNGSCELPAMGGQGHYVWQFYLRRALLDRECLTAIALDFWARFATLHENEPFQLGGVESAAVPIITMLVLAAPKPVTAFTIRKERKAYGLRNVIEGRPDPALPVMFIDDLTSPSHNAFWLAVREIHSAGLRMNGHGYVLVRKQRAAEAAVIPTSSGPVTIQSMFTLDDFSLTLDAYVAEKKDAG